MLGSYFRLVKKASQYYTYVLLNRLMMRSFCMTFPTACKVREFLQQILLVSRLCVKHLTQYLNHLHLCRGLSPQVVNSSTERKILNLNYMFHILLTVIKYINCFLPNLKHPLTNIKGCQMLFFLT